MDLPLDGVPFCGDNTPNGVACLQRTDGGRGGVFFESYQACAQSDILLPGFNLLPDWLLAIVYALTLLWCFFGVAIISDTFMVAIEVITSQTKTVTRRGKDGQQVSLEVYTWNPTVANLTLMALGSSAPEIMLSVIETIVQLGKAPGELGPSTIVGSAAFNLLVIPAVCIMAIPEGHHKRIAQFQVFGWTAAISLFAYIWLLIVYQVWTPDEITIEEAVLTLLYMPLLVAVAWRLDVMGGNSAAGNASDAAVAQLALEGVEAAVTAPGKAEGQEWGNAGLTAHVTGVSWHETAGKSVRLSPQQIAEYLKQHEDLNEDEVAYRLSHGAVLYSHAVASMDSASSGASQPWNIKQHPQQQQQQQQQQHEVQWFPCGALIDSDGERSTEEAEAAEGSARHGGADEAGFSGASPRRSFTDLQYRINARRMLSGRHHSRASSVDSQTAAIVPAGMAMDAMLEEEGQVVQCKADVSFSATHFIVSESQGCARLCVKCHRREDVKLPSKVHVNYRTRDGTAMSKGSVRDYEATAGTLVFGPSEDTKFIEVRVFEDEEVEEDESFFVELSDPGPEGTINILTKEATVVIMDSTEPGRFQFESTEEYVQNSQAAVTLTVVRKLGVASAASVDFKTNGGDALPGVDFEHTEGTLHFESGQKSAPIMVKLLPSAAVGRKFAVVLSNAVTAELSRRLRTVEVEIVEDVKVSKIMMLMGKLSPSKKGVLRLSSWAQQFADAIVPGGADDGDGDEIVTPLDYLLHYISITWKLMFALVPPAEYGGGWPCFVISLGFIALLTYFVAEFATLFGCACGLRDIITAITFVALGTSMPDTFASKQAAEESPDADAAIGNVTGSNSVNVFLGLGLPWLLASIYYKARDEAFVQPSGDLSFSVTVYMVCAGVGIALLLLKRRYGGELGGSGFMRTGVAAVLVLLWIVYVVLSSLKAYNHVDGF